MPMRRDISDRQSKDECRVPYAGRTRRRVAVALLGLGSIPFLPVSSNAQTLLKNANLSALSVSALCYALPGDRPVPADKGKGKSDAPPLSPQKLPPASSGSLANVPQAEMIAKEYRKGVLYGKVQDVTGKPVVGATVALQSTAGKILVWTLTNSEGEYSLPVDPKEALHLRPSRRKGLLEQCARAVGDVAMAPIKAAGTAVANPGKTLAAAAVSAATGTPLPLAAQMAIPGATDKSLLQETEKKAREIGARTAVGDVPKVKPKTEAKGEAHLLVSAPSFKAVQGAAGAYWMERPSPEAERPVGLQAWLETVKLAPAVGDKKSEIAPEAVKLTEALIDPMPVTTGGTIGIAVRLQAPPGLEKRVRMFAREARTSTVVELFPREEEGKKDDGKALFVGAMPLDPRIPAGETTISIAVPPGRTEALTAVTSFLDAAKQDGTVREALDAVGLPHELVAP